MRRFGIVTAINPMRRMVALSSEEGYTIIELLTYFDLEVGDEIFWDSGIELGMQRFCNLTKGSSNEVYVQSHGVQESQLRKQLLLP